MPRDFDARVYLANLADREAALRAVLREIVGFALGLAPPTHEQSGMRRNATPPWKRSAPPT